MMDTTTISLGLKFQSSGAPAYTIMILAVGWKKLIIWIQAVGLVAAIQSTQLMEIMMSDAMVIRDILIILKAETHGAVVNLVAVDAAYNLMRPLKLNLEPKPNQEPERRGPEQLVNAPTEEQTYQNGRQKLRT